MKHQRDPKTEKKIRKTIKRIDRGIYAVVVVILIGLLAFGIYSIWDNRQIDEIGSSKHYEMYKPEPNNTVSYSELVKLNPEVCGWLAIFRTGVDYPLVQATDNDKYMNTTPDLKFALSGSCFLDYKNARDFSDFNTIIYGHHMAHHAMFGDLDQFQKKKYFKRHKTGSIYVGNTKYKLHIAAFLMVNAYDQSIYQIAHDDAAKTAYMNNIRNKAKFFRSSVNIAPTDHIVVLSTCMTDRTDGRYILVAKIGGVMHDKDPKAEKQSLWWLPRLIAAIIAAAIILILGILYARNKKRQKDQQPEHRD